MQMASASSSDMLSRAPKTVWAYEMAQSFAAARRWGWVVPAQREGAPSSRRQVEGAEKMTLGSRTPVSISSTSSQRPDDRLRDATVFFGPKRCSSKATRSGPPASTRARTAFARSNGCTASPESIIRRSVGSMIAQPEVFAASTPKTITWVARSCALLRTDRQLRILTMCTTTRPAQRLRSSRPSRPQALSRKGRGTSRHPPLSPGRSHASSLACVSPCKHYANERMQAQGCSRA